MTASSLAMFFKRQTSKEKPPAYTEMGKGVEDVKDVNESKVAQWKKALEEYEFSDIHFLVDEMISIIDKSVTEEGTFPRGFLIVDVTSTVFNSSIWKTEYDKIQKGIISTDSPHWKPLCLLDSKMENCCRLFTKAKLDDKIVPRLERVMVEKTGLVVKSSSIVTSCRVYKDDPTKEVMISSMRVDISIPEVLEQFKRDM